MYDSKSFIFVKDKLKEFVELSLYHHIIKRHLRLSVKIFIIHITYKYESYSNIVLQCSFRNADKILQQN